MSFIETCLSQWEFNRVKTLAKLDEIAKLPNPQEALGWRPGPGRAHIAWQLVHIGITEELFATERMIGTAPGFAELVPRFRGGSTPDDNIPTLDRIRDVLDASRTHLLQTVSTFQESDLCIIPPAMKERGLSIGQILQVLAWHEGHHQGQAHLTLNLWKAAHPA
ncbi:MAG: DinB family protein [Planctomycetota bacterium]